MNFSMSTSWVISQLIPVTPGTAMPYVSERHQRREAGEKQQQYTVDGRNRPQSSSVRVGDRFSPPICWAAAYSPPHRTVNRPVAESPQPVTVEVTRPIASSSVNPCKATHVHNDTSKHDGTTALRCGLTA